MHPEDAGRASSHDRVLGYVACYDRARSDDRVLPDREAAQDDRARPYRCSASHDRSLQRPVAVSLKGAVIGEGAGIAVVGEDDTVPNEYAVAELDSLADKRMARDLAASPDDRTFLDLDEGADTRPVADAAAVEVRERLDHDVLPEVDRVQ